MVVCVHLYNVDDLRPWAWLLRPSVMFENTSPVNVQPYTRYKVIHGIGTKHMIAWRSSEGSWMTYQEVSASLLKATARGMAWKTKATTYCLQQRLRYRIYLYLECYIQHTRAMCTVATTTKDRASM